MAVIITMSPENSMIGKKPRKPRKKEEKKQKLTREQEMEIEEAERETKYASFKKHAERIPVLTKGRDIIFLGVSAEGAKRKAILFTCEEECRETKYAYLLKTDKEGVKFELPRKMRMLYHFSGTLKIIDEAGVQSTMEGEHIFVYDKNEEICIRIGLSEHQKKKMEKRAKAFAKKMAEAEKAKEEKEKANG